MDKLVLTKLQEAIIESKKGMDGVLKANTELTILDAQKAQSMYLTMILSFVVGLVSDKEIVNGLSELLAEHINRSLIESAIGANADVYSDLNRDTLKFVTKAAVQAKAA
ncbi:hypothetical protein AAFX60_006990 [Aliivibrio fischeri]